jgi:hypothetical protein
MVIGGYEDAGVFGHGVVWTHSAVEVVLSEIRMPGGAALNTADVLFASPE